MFTWIESGLDQFDSKHLKSHNRGIFGNQPTLQHLGLTMLATNRFIKGNN